jgi:hypothetical protein
MLGLIVIVAMTCLTTWSIDTKAQARGARWTPVEKAGVAGADFLASPRFEQSVDSALVLYGAALGAQDGMARLEWQDTTWVTNWHINLPIGFLWPVPSTTGTQTLVWKDERTVKHFEYLSEFMWADADARGIASVDTLTRVRASTTEYGAAVTLHRRWVAVSDFANLRFFSARTGEKPIEWEVGGQADGGIALAPLNDSTAMVVWSGINDHLQWALAKGDAWIPQGLVPDSPFLVERPRMRLRPSGGVWVAWATVNNDILMRSYSDEGWGPLQRFSSQFGGTADYYTYAPDLSRDGLEWPILSWTTADARSGVETICVAATEPGSSFAASRIVGSEGGLISSVARDKYGDVWVAWWRYYDGIFWTHTYTHSSPSAPVVVRTDALAQISWSLSEPSPGSHWSVMRSTDEGPFYPIGGIVAGQEATLRWDDRMNSPESVLRYRIRRDCLDARYEMLGPVSATSTINKPSLALTLESGNPVSQSLRMALLGASAGPAHIQLIDSLGRLQAINANSDVSGPYARTIVTVQPESRLRAGVYFVRAIDSSGARTEPVKVVFLP